MTDLASFHRTRLLGLASHAGFHPYALDQAQRLEREDRAVYGGIVAAVEGAMGLEAVREARAALVWFEKHPATP